MKKKIDIANIPQDSGVYLMKDKNESIIYVGKAKNIRSRISNYFNASTKDIKTRFLVSKIDKIETIVTNTELEAFILEANLIKKHKPHYNIVLKDDKKHLSLKIDLKDKYPRLNFVRKVTKEKSVLYFGPFASGSSIRETVKFINKVFKLRKCKNKNFLRKTRPCINYQINRCLAPCYFDVDEKKYKNIIDEVSLFLKGKQNELISNIKEEINKASLSQNYEYAANLRDKLLSIKKIAEKQAIFHNDFLDKDIIAVAKKENFVIVVMLFIRNSFLNGNKTFKFENIIEDKNEIMESFIKQYYQNATFIPKEIVISEKLSSARTVEEFIRETPKVKIINPVRGKKKDILKIAQNNAEKELKLFTSSNLQYEKIHLNLKRILRLEKMPERIECFDNSHISGSMPVAGMVVFNNGKKETKSYRKYILKTTKKADDYAYMMEALERRYSKKENLPDILLLDGGKSQLSAANIVLDELNLLKKISVISLAKKDKNKKEKFDKVYKLGRSNELNIEPNTLAFLERVRNESHRFVNTFQAKKRNKETISSFFGDIKGVGINRKKMLLNHFGSVEKIKEASVSELCKIDGITETIANKIKEGDKN